MENTAEKNSYRFAKTSLPSSKRFTGIFCSSFSSKLKSELIKISRNAPWTKSTDGLRDEKCPEVVLVSVTCQFKPIGSLRSLTNEKINSSRAGSLYLAPFFSPALGRGSPSKQVSLLAGYKINYYSHGIQTLPYPASTVASVFPHLGKIKVTLLIG